MKDFLYQGKGKEPIYFAILCEKKTRIIFNAEISKKICPGSELTSPLESRDSTLNQVTGYELTSQLWLRVDFPGTG